MATKKENTAPEKKTAAKKPAAKTKTPAKSTAKKPASKSVSKTPAAKAPKKKGLSYDVIFDAAKKKVGGADVSKLKYPIAVNVELNGSADGIFYIYVSDGTIAVEPYRYDDYDVYIRADAEELFNVLNGKKNIYDAFAGGLIKIDGNTKKSILFVHAAL